MLLCVRAWFSSHTVVGIIDGVGEKVTSTFELFGAVFGFHDLRGTFEISGSSINFTLPDPAKATLTINGVTNQVVVSGLAIFEETSN